MEVKSTLEQLEEKLAVTQLTVFEKRSTVPQQCATLLAHNLKLQLEQTKKNIYLPKLENRKSIYSIHKPLGDSFDIPKSKVAVEELPTLLADSHEDFIILSDIMSSSFIKTHKNFKKLSEDQK